MRITSDELFDLIRELGLTDRQQIGTLLDEVGELDQDSPEGNADPDWDDD
jgi:hypothetical protein